jgi:hypothetical protein
MNIIKSFVFSITFLVLGFSFSQENCRDFSNGVYKLLSPDGNMERIITLSDTLFSDQDIETALRTRYKMIWATNCEFLLTFLDGPEPFLSKYTGKKIKCTITETTENSFTFKMEIIGEDNVVTYTFFTIG